MPVKDHLTAREKAEALLLSLLPPLQQDWRSGNGWFELPGAWDCRYRFGHRQFVKRHLPNGEVESLCVHVRLGNPDWPYDEMPPGDHIVAQLLMFLADEREFLARCAVSIETKGGGYGGWKPQPWVPEGEPPIVSAITPRLVRRAVGNHVEYVVIE